MHYLKKNKFFISFFMSLCENADNGMCFLYLRCDTKFLFYINVLVKVILRKGFNKFGYRLKRKSINM